MLLRTLAFPPVTLLQKSFIRLVRNRGALAALPLPSKLELAKFFCGPSLWGWGLTYVLMAARVRMGLHKHAREGLVCLLESCTLGEYEAVLGALGGRRGVLRRLRGWSWLASWHYSRRVGDVEAVHREAPCQLAYLVSELRYAALTPSSAAEAEAGCRGGLCGPGRELHAITHTRDKTAKEEAW